MARVKRGVVAGRRHKKVLAKAKGYYNARRKVFRAAKQAVIKAGQYAYRDRRAKKREFRALWIARINAAAREHGLSYSRLINGLLKAGHRDRPQGAGGTRRARCGGVWRHLRTGQGAAQGRLKRRLPAPARPEAAVESPHRADPARARGNLRERRSRASRRCARAVARQEGAAHRAAQIARRAARERAAGSRRAHQRSEGSRAGRASMRGARMLERAGDRAQARRRRVDVTLDGRGERNGGLHPVTRARLRIERLFREVGLRRGRRARRSRTTSTISPR